MVPFDLSVGVIVFFALLSLAASVVNGGLGYGYSSLSTPLALLVLVSLFGALLDHLDGHLLDRQWERWLGLRGADTDRLAAVALHQALADHLGEALQGTFLDFLFPVEETMDEQARTAGLRMVTFPEPQVPNSEPEGTLLAQFVTMLT